MKEKMLKAYHGLARVLDRVCLTPGWLAMFLVIALIPATSPNEYTLRVLITCLLRGAQGMGFDLSSGFIGVANWGYAALAGLAGYTSALLCIHFSLSPWITMLLGGLMATLVGLVIGLLTLKMEGIFAALLAWFVGLILQGACGAMTWLTKGQLGLQVPSLFDTPWAKPYFYVILVICLGVFVAMRTITRSNLGLAFRALGQDMQAAQTTGISVLKYRLTNFCISCFVAGLCGAFNAHFIGILTPGTLATKNTIEILVIAYLGGRGSIWGPLLAAFIITPIFESLNHLVEIKYIIYGVVLILVMIFMPNGIAGVLGDCREKLSQKAKRKNVDK